MASIANDPNGRKRILFVARDGSRKTIRLGKMDGKQAATIRGHIEHLVAASRSNDAPPVRTVEWLTGLDDITHGRIAAVGLVKPRDAVCRRLGDFMDKWFARLEVKPNTFTNYSHTRRCLVEFFGRDKLLTDIGRPEADDWREWLKGQGLATATISKRVIIARHIFAQAVDYEYMPRNPFAKVKAGKQDNKARQCFVTLDTTEKVLAACPDAEWRLIFALARYGGLRCPSEVLALRWDDVNWSQDKFLVRSCKTEHIEGHESRYVPIFPELRPYLMDAFEAAEPGAVYAITRYRDASCNLRTQLGRILKRAGVLPWPKLFQNLRSTRQTELENQYPSYKVCAWIGNSEKVAAKHYLQLQESDYGVAASTPTPRQAAQNAAQQITQEPCSPLQSAPPMDAANRESIGDFKDSQDLGVSYPQLPMGQEGRELPAKTPGKTAVLDGGGAESGALDGLAVVVDAWPRLADATRAAILRLCGASLEATVTFNR